MVFFLKKWFTQIDSEYILLLLDDHIIKIEYKHIEILLKNLKRKYKFCTINICK